MIVYFADRKMNIAGLASTDLREGLLIRDDVKTEDVDTGVASFGFTVPYSAGEHADVKKIIREGNYILRNYDTECEFYTILDVEDDSEKEEISVYAEDAGLDLLNEIVGEFAAAEAQPVTYYVSQFAYDTGFEIGINEISDRTRKLSWDGESTAAARIRSVATQFDAEIGYRFDINGLKVAHKYIDFYKRRGKDIARELRLHREIGRIIEKRSIANLVTALRVTGGIPEGEEDPVTLDGVTYDDGDIYVENGMLFSRSALAEWSRYLSETGDNVGHIVGAKTYEATTQSGLLNSAKNDLIKYSKPEVTYEAEILDLPENLKIGDTVRIIDMDGELYLSARLLKMETRASERTQTATLGDYLPLSSGISDEVRAMVEEFRRTVKSRYTWYAYADDAQGNGISLSPTGKAYMGVAANRLTQIPEITDPSVYTWSLIQGERGTGIWKITTAPRTPSSTVQTEYQDAVYVISRTTAMSESGADKILVGDILEYDTYHYPVLHNDTSSSYIILGDRVSFKGTDGVSVVSVTSTNNQDDGGTSTVTVTYSDGSTDTFYVKNGSAGTSSEWYYGTDLVHTSGAATLAASVTSGVTVGSMYLNPSTSLVYKCTAISQDGTTATWTYAGDLTTGVLENIEIGGRNLFRGSSNLTGSMFAGPRSSVVTSGVDNDVSVLRLVPTADPAIAKAKIDYLFYKDYEDTDLTVSFDAREAPRENEAYDSAPFYAYVGVQDTGRVDNYFNQNYERYLQRNTGSSSTDWERYSLTWHIPDDLTTGQASVLADSSLVTFQMYRYGSTVPVEIRNIKFERGSKATDWTPAPEDVAGAISTAQSLAEENRDRITDVTETANGAAEAVENEAEARAQAITTVTNSINALDTNTVKVTEYNAYKTNVTGQLEAINARLEQTAGYIRFDDQLGKIEVGKVTSDNTYTVTIEGNVIYFKDAGDVVAFLAQRRLEIDEVYAHNQHKIGPFAFIRRSSGNLSFLYVGGEEE